MSPGVNRTWLRCDPWGAIAWRVFWLWLFGGAWLHLGTEFRPWSPGTDWGMVLGGVVMIAWGAWHILAWLGSSVGVDRQDRVCVLRRLTWAGLDERVIGLDEIAAVVLVKKTGPGRYLWPPSLIELRLRSGELVELGTIATVFLLDDYAATLAVLLDTAVEAPPSLEGTV